VPDEFYASVMEAGNDGVWPRLRGFVVLEPRISEMEQLLVETGPIVCRTVDRASRKAEILRYRIIRPSVCGGCLEESYKALA
jgi:hypothetical protein